MPDGKIPEGAEFLSLVDGQEFECTQATNERLPSMGRKAPVCHEQLGTVLSLLDRVASCWWSCDGGDHVVEYLCGRAVSSGCASLRLLKSGYYDECLALTRGVGEIANLFQLFAEDKAALKSWREASRKERLREFSPAKVRLKLTVLAERPAIDQERYSLLCERGAHVHPLLRPQAHNPFGLPLVGGVLQEQGVLVCLNELALAVSVVACFAMFSLNLDKELKTQIVSAATVLAEQIGRATITEIDDYYRELDEEPEAKQRLDEVAASLRALQKSRHR